MQIDQPFELVLFGGVGDLALRKLLPALYLLDVDGRLPAGRIVALGRSAIEASDFCTKIEKSIQQHVSTQYQDDEVWQRFEQRLQYVQLDITQASGFDGLTGLLSADCPNRLYYLATASSLYADICQNLHANDLINDACKVVMEKPIGHDLSSAQLINESVAGYFNESQIYRIDHYLGKETVQNLMVLRFANSLFESQWNQHYIDHIQITISESLGVEKRAGFYEQVGAFRDMMQNHLLQLLCITAMEPPSKMEPDAVRDEKVKVIKALRPIEGKGIQDKVIRGQYGRGVSANEAVPKYKDEDGVAVDSQTETFVAMKVEVDNWRWAGVPFYLRTGKRLAERACEIVVQFKEVPHSIFAMQHKETMANKLVFRLQPDEGIRLQICEKRVGSGMKVRPMNLSLSPEEQKKQRVPEAYERLLLDALSGNATLFLRDDELMEAWRWVDPILSDWLGSDSSPETYTAGSWGPAAATLLLAKDGRLWDENS